MDKNRKVELVQRSLGIRHKLKVHDSMKAPDTHAELALMLLSRWELEDELHAIEEVLSDIRQANVATRKSQLIQDKFPVKATAPGLVRGKKAATERASG